MPVTSVSIKGLRGFQAEQEIALAIPRATAGSGLTVLIGPNNAGKSTVIEALRAMMSAGNKDRSFPEATRNVAAGGGIRIMLRYGPGQSQALETVAAGGSETDWKHEGSFTPTPLLAIPARRAFAARFAKGADERHQYQLRLSGSGHRPLSQDTFGNRLFRIHQNRAAFDALLSRVLSPVPKWHIDQTSSGDYYLRIESGMGSHDSEGLGDGILSLFVIIDALYDSEPGELIAIDEPELSLHPTSQKKLAALLRDYAAQRQIIIATHSPYFVEPDMFADGSRLVRVHLGKSGSVVSQLSEQTGSEVARMTTDINNPHLFGLNAREALFHDDGIILYEGQDDVQLIGRVQNEAGLRVAGMPFGWGVGGADKMRLIASLFDELGYERVVGVLDANRAPLVAELRRQFPNYFFCAQPADDIRTKRARTLPAVKGLLDENYHVRDEYRSAAVELLQEINEYLQRAEARRWSSRSDR